MKLKTTSCVAVLLLLICCFSQAFGQTVKKIDDASAWLYHPDKDQYVGSYEWWYMDAHLDNGWLVAVVFGVPRATSLEYYKYRADLAAGLPVPSYDPKNYAALGFNVTDEKGRHLFEATEKVPIDRLLLPTREKMRLAFNDCQLEMSRTGALPTFTVRMDIRDKDGNVAKATLVFNALVPAVSPGRGRTFDAEVNGRRVYDEWFVFAPVAKVKADIAITNKETGSTAHVKEDGFGYHDKNLGNHYGSETAKGWIWSRIAEEDLTIVFAEVPNYHPSLYPTYQACIIAYKGNLLASTEALDYAKGPAAVARLAYPTESTVTFKPESGVKGTLKFSDLKMIFERGPYSRLVGSWALDIETKYGKLKRGGNKLLFEYSDFSAAAK